MLYMMSNMWWVEFHLVAQSICGVRNLISFPLQKFSSLFMAVLEFLNFFTISLMMKSARSCRC